MQQYTERGRSMVVRPAMHVDTHINGHEEMDEEPDLHSDSDTSESTSLLNDERSTGERREPSSDPVEDFASYSSHFSAKRHTTCGNPTLEAGSFAHMRTWRLKEKIKTSNAALVVCLNIDVDPPDIVKTNPCAVLECWVDPHSLPSNKALEAIGNNLHHQFECLSPRIKFKPYLDPSYEETQKFCINLRKMARDERCLFYYNGHGVPKPTSSGELWVFNRTYSQYIPVSLHEIQQWLGSPCIYIWDCSAAGNLVNNFVTFAQRRDAEMEMKHGGYPDGIQPYMECIQLAACLSHEQLPMFPELPADLFTSCLTSPIDVALRWFVVDKTLPSGPVNHDMVQRIPGDLKDRRTPLGELNWIFTAITDTIAWTTFSRELFTRLYRSDLLVASLFRNFLLAERIMKNYHCTPHTYPPLPATNTHPMWAQWDLAVDHCLRQLPDLLNNEETPTGSTSTPGPDIRYIYKPNRFFLDHLKAFDIWISQGGTALTRRGPGSLGCLDNGRDKDFGTETSNHLVPRNPPEQLPIVLQLLLSQPHRLRALVLLSKFVDLGPWAVHYALTIGIFPFISKLLQSPAPELRPVLIFIWARILAVDPSCRNDLYHSHGYKYFAVWLGVAHDAHEENEDGEEEEEMTNGSEHTAMICFVLSTVCRGFMQGQIDCMNERALDSCLIALEKQDALQRQWVALCIGQLWDGNDDVKLYGVDRRAHEKLLGLLCDDSPEVRTAALFALGTFMGASGSADPENRGGRGTGCMPGMRERDHFRMEVAVATGVALQTKEDASPMVRKELLILLSCLVREWRGYFVIVAWLYWEEERKRAAGPPRTKVGDDITDRAVDDWIDSIEGDDVYREEERVALSSFYTVYVFLLELSVDPYPEVSAYAQTIVDYVTALLLESPFAQLSSSTLHIPPPALKHRQMHAPEPRSRLPSLQSTVTPYVHAARIPLTRSDSAASAASSGSSNILRRTTSFANSLKNLANSFAFPSLSTEDASGFTSQQNVKLTSDGADTSYPPSPNLNVSEYTPPYLADPLVYNKSTEDRTKSPCNFSSTDVIIALIEEDKERLRGRRPRLSQYTHPAGNAMGSIPLESSFDHGLNGKDCSINPLLGTGTGAGVIDVLPLKSRFYDWCCEYFTESQMRQPESQEPGSIQYNEQMLRQQRNEKVMHETQTQIALASRCGWERPVATLHHNGPVSNLSFHPFDPHVFASNDSNMISVFDWTTRKRMLIFNNGNPIGTSITSLQCINHDIGGMIMAGSSDGIVRLYRNYDPAYWDRQLQMVTSFRALSRMVHLRRGSGLTLEWQPASGTIIASGDSRTVRLWDAHRENIAFEFSTQSESPVTSIVSDPDAPSIFAMSFGDGTIQLYDKRLDDKDAVMSAWKAHDSWVHGVRWQRGGTKDFVSASADGVVKLWDLRRAQNSIMNWTVCPQGLSAFDVHHNASVFAASAVVSQPKWRHQDLVVHSLQARPPNQPDVLSRLSFASGLHHPPSRESTPSAIPSPSNLAFHPQEMIFGIGSIDGTIRLMGCKLVEQPDDGSQSVRDFIGTNRSQNGHAFRSLRSISP